MMRKTARAIIIKDNKILLMYRNKFGEEYYSLIGGAIEVNETPEEALFREVKEETTLIINSPKLVIIEDAGSMFGIQYIYLCQYVSGEPQLDQNSMEFKITKDGKNIYKPLWLDVNLLSGVNLLPVELKDTLLDNLNNGFPDDVLNIKINS